MVQIELLKLTDEFVKYKYFPESSKEYGIVTLNRKSKERIFEKILAGYSTSYAAHALKRIEEYQDENNFKQKDLIAWY